MRFVACSSCECVIQIGGDLNEVNSLLGMQESFPCVTPLCRGRMVQVGLKIPTGYKMRNMPIRAFYRAVNGFGPGPDSLDPASLKRLKEILLSRKVVDLRAEQIGQPQRVILRELIMDDGTRLHFETSAKGACVYYIEEPGPSCLEVVENELASAATDKSGNSNREETGRASQTDCDGLPREAQYDSSGRATELSNAEGVPPLSEKSGLLPSFVPGCSNSGSY